MNLRILSFAALSGMLAAAGCGGGTGTGIAPTVGNSTGGTGVPSSKSRGTLSASFDIPARYVKQAASSSSSARKPAYISPGSSGIEVILGGSTATVAATAGTVTSPTWIVGHSGEPLALTGTPGVSFSGNSLVGTVGYLGGATVAYSYVPSSTNSNYYTFTFSITGLQTNAAIANAADASYSIGVVLTDLTNHNFVLSEGQSNAVLTATVVPLSITLKPVVDKAYLVGPSLVAASSLGGAGTFGPASPSYEFTLYAADELGYVIPNGAALNTFDGQTLSVAQYPAVSSSVTTLLFDQVIAASYANPGTNPLPTLGTAYAQTTLSTAIAAPGSTVAIAAPAGGAPNLGPVYRAGSSYASGVPVLVEPGTAAGQIPSTVVGVSAYLTAPSLGTYTNGAVSGYSYTTGVNMPAGGTNAIGTPSSVNFTAGLYPVVQ